MKKNEKLIFFSKKNNQQNFADIEEDEIYGPCIVGRGGPPNSAGYHEYDAALMDGATLRFGAVTALRGYGAKEHSDIGCFSFS